MEYLGIDFGTTNTLCGVIDDNKKVKLVPLEIDSKEMPSAIFLKVRNRKRLVLNEDVFERRVEEILKYEQKKLEVENSSVARRLDDFRRANRPKFKEPKPYDFYNSEKYNLAMQRYLLDTANYSNIIQLFEKTRVVEEEEKIRKSIYQLTPMNIIRDNVRAKMEQELIEEELELIQSVTFFTALNDPDVTRFFGQSAIDQYKNDPMSGFFMRSPKAFLGISLSEIQKELFVQVIALVLTEIKQRSEDYLGTFFSGVVLGRPVNYAGAQAKSDNQQALDIMKKAAQLAGFKDIRFVIEPMAASLVISRAMFDSSAPALVIDVGGGTTDIILLKVDPEADEKLKVLNAEGERVGGNDFDEILAKKRFSPFLGGNVVLKDGRTMPNQVVMDALTTRDIHKQAAFRKKGLEIHKNISLTEDPLSLRRLYQLFQMQLQHQILLISEEAKKELSSKDLFDANFPFFDYPFNVMLKREELFDVYENELSIIKRNILSVFDGYLESGQSYRVFLTGGMSKCSALIEAIQKIIPAGIPINRIPALQSVAAGIAVVARQLSLSDDSHTDNFSVRGIPVTR